MCWVQVAYAIIIAIVGELLRPKARTQVDKPKNLGDFTFPTAEAGRAFPIWCGTVLLTGMNTTAAGNLTSYETYKRVKTGWFSTSKQHLGWQYTMSFQQVIGRGGLEDVVGVQVDQKLLKIAAKTNTTHYVDVQINDPSFYGDPKVDGGFSGIMRFYKGTPDQPVDDMLQSVLAMPDIPAYRYISYVMFRKFYVGMSVNPSPFCPIVSKWPNTLGLPDAQRKINGTAANPSAWAYYVMTESILEAGIPPGLIDKPSFLKAGETLFNEKIGMNQNIDSQLTLRDFLDTIEEAADGKIFEDPFTGLWTFTLARQDYDLEDLPVLNESNSTCVGRAKSDWYDLKNVFNVAYVDKDRNWTNQSVSVKDQANLAATGQQVNALDLTYEWCDNIDLAYFLAERARVMGATPFTQLQIEANGAGENLRINDVFIAQYPNSRRITQMVMRVTDIEYAGTDEAITKITAVEDKFGTKYVSYTGVPDTSWTQPTYDPLPLAEQALVEFPYGATPDSNRQDVTVVTIGGRAGGVETSYDIYSSTPVDGNQHYIANVDGFAPFGYLQFALSKGGPYFAEMVVVYGVQDAQQLDVPTPEQIPIGQAMFLIGDEWFSYTGLVVSGTTVTLTGVSGGAYDTIPADHPVGSRVFFLEDGQGSIGTYTVDYTANAKLPTRTYDQVLPMAQAVPIILATQSRAKRPYPPHNVKVNDVNLLGSSIIDASSGSMTITWSQTNRLTQDRAPGRYNSADTIPEAGTAYRFKVYDADGTLIYTSSDYTGNTATFSVTYNGPTTVKAYAVRDGLESLFPVSGLVQFGVPVDPLMISGDAPDGNVGYPYGDTPPGETFRLQQPDGSYLTTPNGTILRKP